MSDPRFDEILLESIIKRKDILPGGLADNAPDSEFDPEQLKMGITSELEHTSSRKMAKEIAKDHLKEDPKYYTKLKKMEESKVVSEKQSDAERHQKHKEWRKKNPQKVRDQVARHQEKTDQNRSREDTRLRDEPKKPCADCGSTENVQRDHDRGYGKGAPTTPRCHTCHTNRPQQNKSGQKSVKGGTVRVKKENKKIDPFIKIIMDNMSII